MEYLNSLKNLYGLNEAQMDDLKQTVKLNILPTNIDDVKSKLDNMMKQQTSIKKQIPQDRFNNVSNFIIEIYSYINDAKSNITKINSHVNRVYDLSNYHMDSTILRQKQGDRETERMNIPQISSKHDSNQPNKTHQPQLPRQAQKPDILDGIDPYELFGYSQGQKLILQDLKDKYKKFALQTHPDKNNGDARNFNIVNEAFKFLYEEYKLKQNDKQFNELKNNSNSYIEKQYKTNSQNTQFSKDNFSVNKFNSIYDKHRIGNVNDDGYGDWSQSNSFDSEDIVKDSSITTGNFNSMFNSNVKVSSDLIKHQNPTEMFMNSENNCEELGTDKIDNYTGKSKSINYTDYKEAHTTSRLVDPNTKYNTYNSVGEVEAARSNIKDLTAEELMDIELEKSRKEEQEEHRLKQVSKQDNAHFDNYNKIHNIMLNRR
jgi:curved DNA-binding protein CbpA